MNILFWSFSTSVNAQESSNVAPLRWRSGTEIVDLRSTETWNHTAYEAWPAYQGMHYGLLYLQHFPDNADRELLAEQGVHILRYVPDGWFVCGIRQGADISTLEAFGMASHLPFPTSAKWLEPFESDAPEVARSPAGEWLINLHCFPTVEWEVFRTEVQKTGWKIVEERPTYGFLSIAIPESEFFYALEEQLVVLPFIEAIDWAYDYGQPENYTGRSLHRVNFVGNEVTNGVGYDGTGIHVMLQDDGFIGPHIDRKGREVEQFWSADLGDHGDHVSGTIMGAGNLNPYHEGMAPGSDLYVYKAAPEYQGFDSLAAHYVSREIVLTSTSYSNGCNAGYTALTQTMDNQVQTMEHLMHVFSAGNSGTSNCGYGAGNLWGNITGGHKMGKNVITVGNLDENDLISTSSSRGPADDGRIKPDVCAKGTQVTSTIAGNTYDTYNGTSMACPGVSGTLAVLYQAFEDQQGSLPPAGLMKAIVMNTAEDLGNAGPDFIHGWGRINARRANDVIAATSFTSAQLADGDSALIPIDISGDIARVRFMLYWTDPEASISAATALVNDLDLRVYDPNSTLHLPYVLDPTPNAASLNTPATHGEDHLNNVEQVEIFSPVSGNYIIKVNGFQIPDGPQTFYLVYWVESDTTHLTYPVGGESLVPFTTEKIRWDAPEGAPNLNIEYSLNGGSSWNALATNVGSSAGYYDWNVPNAATGNAMVRIVSNGQTSTSEPFSIIATPSNLQVVYSCPDSIGLTWNNASGATGYEVYRLGVKYMDPIGTSSTNDFADYTANPLSSELWYSVASTGNDNALGKRMIAVQKNPGIFNCPIAYDNALAEVYPSAGAWYDCFGDSIRIKALVRNESDNPTGPISVDLYENGLLIATESFSLNLSPGSEDTIVFSQKIAAPSTVSSIMLVMDYAADGNPYNDTLRATYTSVSSTMHAPLWKEDFDAFDLCATTSDCGGTVCPLTGGWLNQETGVIDGADWRTNVLTTPSDATGPQTDHTLGNADGRYLYLEASGGCGGLEAHLISPCIDLTGSTGAQLQFWYHMYGFDMGSLSVDVFDGEVWHLDVMAPLAGNQGNSWNLAQVSLAAFSGQVINVRFRGIIGNDYRSDMAIDDIQIHHPPVANFTFQVQNDGSSVDFVDLSAFADSMVFDLGDGTALGYVPLVHTYAQQVVYLVKQEVFNDFGTDQMLQYITTLGEGSDMVSSSDIRLFPNPAHDRIEVISGMRMERLEVFATDGRLVLKVMPESDYNIILDTEDWARGTYLLQITGDQGTVRSVLVLQ